MNEDDALEAAEDKIRSARKAAPMKAVAISE
jgi:hypothetical protein